MGPWICVGSSLEHCGKMAASSRSDMICVGRLPGGPAPAQTKSVESLPTIVQESNRISLETKNRHLEQEITRLEQAAALREEMSRRLREKLEKLELELKERDRFQQQDITFIQKDNREKENLIL